MKAAHSSVECAALSFPLFGLQNDGVYGLWVRPPEPLSFDPPAASQRPRTSSIEYAARYPRTMGCSPHIGVRNPRRPYRWSATEILLRDQEPRRSVAPPNLYSE